MSSKKQNPKTQSPSKPAEASKEAPSGKEPEAELEPDDSNDSSWLSGLVDNLNRNVTKDKK